MGENIDSCQKWKCLCGMVLPDLGCLTLTISVEHYQYDYINVTMSMQYIKKIKTRVPLNLGLHMDSILFLSPSYCYNWDFILKEDMVENEQLVSLMIHCQATFYQSKFFY